MEVLSKLKIKLFADGANLNEMLDLHQNPSISGFTTNPSLMRKAGVEDYRAFAHTVLRFIQDRPISFEVFADDFDAMEAQAHEIASWGKNVLVKIPVTNTKGQFSGPLIKRLSLAGIPLNITAILTLPQVQAVADCLTDRAHSIVSIFAGRIADTGVDPVPMMMEALNILKPLEKTELLWASPREILNVIQANEIGCHIITATNDILKKLNLLGKDLTKYSLETVCMFYDDACSAGYSLDEKVIHQAV